MKKLICASLITVFLLTGCGSYKGDVIEQKMVMTQVVSKDSRWNTGTKSTHYYVTVKYENLEVELDSWKLYNIVNANDDLQLVYSKYKNSDGYLVELELP